MTICITPPDLLAIVRISPFPPLPRSACFFVAPVHHMGDFTIASYEASIDMALFTCWLCKHCYDMFMIAAKHKQFTCSRSFLPTAPSVLKTRVHVVKRAGSVARIHGGRVLAAFVLCRMNKLCSRPSRLGRRLRVRAGGSVCTHSGCSRAFPHLRSPAPSCPRANRHPLLSS